MNTQIENQDKPKENDQQSSMICTSSKIADSPINTKKPTRNELKEKGSESSSDDKEDDDFKLDYDNYTEKSFTSKFKSKEQEQEIREKIMQITNYYTLNFSGIKNKKELEREPLN